jgi:NTE family protein
MDRAGEAQSSPPKQHQRVRSYGRDPEPGIALCLSGGGFRAAFYHLGALQCLNDLGVLPRVAAIASVSGGSIAAAHIATALPWPLTRPLSPAEWEIEVAQPLRKFASRDRRSWPLFTGTFHPTSSCVEELANEFEQLWGRKSLRQLPEYPSFIICATNLSHGSLWSFEREQMGDEEFGFQHPPSDDISLALAVATSACFTPVFPPLELKIADASSFKGGRRRVGPTGASGRCTLWLCDGGAYDNLGLEAVWRDHSTILVSDAGAPLTREWNQRWLSRVRSAGRVANVSDQLGRLARRRWFISRVEEGVQEGAYWGIASTSVDIADLPGFPGYSGNLVRDVIARVRTDLDAFSDAEQRVLENHGYTLASVALQSWGARGTGLHAPPRTLPPPHAGDYLDEQWVRRELGGRGFLLPRWLQRVLRPKKQIG